MTIFHSSVADSIHPYNHSSSPIYGNWQHVIEPLIELEQGFDCLDEKGFVLCDHDANRPRGRGDAHLRPAVSRVGHHAIKEGR